MKHDQEYLGSEGRDQSFGAAMQFWKGKAEDAVLPTREAGARWFVQRWEKLRGRLSMEDRNGQRVSSNGYIEAMQVYYQLVRQAPEASDLSKLEDLFKARVAVQLVPVAYGVFIVLLGLLVYWFMASTFTFTESPPNGALNFMLCIHIGQKLAGGQGWLSRKFQIVRYANLVLIVGISVWVFSESTSPGTLLQKCFVAVALAWYKAYGLFDSSSHLTPEQYVHALRKVGTEDIITSLTTIFSVYSTSQTNNDEQVCTTTLHCCFAHQWSYAHCRLR